MEVDMDYMKFKVEDGKEVRVFETNDMRHLATELDVVRRNLFDYATALFKLANLVKDIIETNHLPKPDLEIKYLQE
jgi:hypothetical protein